MVTTQKYFDENPFDIVNRIENSNNPFCKYIYLSKADAIINILNLPNRSKVLDIGCGTGYTTLMHNGFNNYQVTSMDISKNEVYLGKAYTIKYSKTNEFLIGDALNLPFKNDSYDAVFCNYLLHHIDNYQTVIGEMVRVAKKICCVEPNEMNPMQKIYQRSEIAKMAGDTKAFYLHQLVNDLKNAGLMNIQIKRINCIFPKAPKSTFRYMVKMDKLFQELPVINLFSGSLVISGEK